MNTIKLSTKDTTALLQRATVEGLVAFSKASTVAASFTHEEMKRRVLLKLADSFDHAEALLSSLEEFNCVLSGRWLLSLIDPFGIETYDYIDILAGNGQYSLFVHWLETNEKAKLLRCITHLPEFATKSYHCALEFQLPRTMVRVVRCVANDPCFLVANYESTHLMNYLSASHLLVAYPTMTFRREGILIGCQPPETHVGTYKIKPRTGTSRGMSCDRSEGCGGGMCWFDDGLSAAIGLRADFVINGRIHWRLGGVKCNTACDSEEHMVGYVEEDDD